MIDTRKINLLGKRVDKAIQVFNNVISELESTNKEYSAMKNQVDTEIFELANVSDNLQNSIDNNNKLLENFKNLLK